MVTLWYNSPLGMLTIEGNDQGVHRIGFLERSGNDTVPEAAPDTVPAALSACLAQLEEYFAGERETFHDLKLGMLGTDFQTKVWSAAIEIPFGSTVTYGELAEHIGEPRAARAVGNALNANPLLLVVPCHRILPSTAKDGDCGGFGCGKWRKEWLLDHEQGRTV